MTTKEASEKFEIDVKKIRELCQKELIIGAKKEKQRWIIPNDTKFLIAESGIVYILWEILNIKLNENYAFSIKYIDTFEKAKECFHYLRSIGYLSTYDEEATDVFDLFSSSRLSQRGIEFLYNKSSSDKIEFYFCKNFSLFDVKGIGIG